MVTQLSTQLEEALRAKMSLRPQTVDGREPDLGWALPAWEELAHAGAPWVGLPAPAGGAGGTLRDACAVLRAVARQAVPLPVAETGLLAGWLLAGAGRVVPRVPLTVGGYRAGDRIELRREGVGWRLTCLLRRVPWGGFADQLVMLAPEGEDRSRYQVVTLSRQQLRITPGHNLADEPRDGVSVEGLKLEPDQVVPAPAGVDPAAVRSRGALTRAVLLASAAERIAELTLAYARGREQFGRPIARFQAVQQHLVRVASEAALATMGATVAVEAAEARGSSVPEVWAAKAVSARCAGVVAALAHQVHGAVGMTQESDLHLLTRRVWSWQQEFGSEREWDRRLGEHLGSEPAVLWPRLAGRLDSQAREG